jgi:hypothetical protein
MKLMAGVMVMEDLFDDLPGQKSVCWRLLTNHFPLDCGREALESKSG